MREHRKWIVERLCQLSRRIIVVVLKQFIPQHRPHPQHEPRGNCRARGIALGMAQHHLGRTQRCGEIVRRKADAEIAIGHTQRTQNGRRKQRLRRGRGGPGALGHPAADDQIGPARPRLNQPIDGKAWVSTPRRPHGDPVQRIAQHRGEAIGINPRVFTSSSPAQVFNKARQRPAIGPAPSLAAADRFGGSGKGAQRIIEARFFAQRKQRREQAFDHLPPIRDALMHLLQPCGNCPQRYKARRRARPAQGKVKHPNMIEPIRPPERLTGIGMPQKREQRHRRGLTGRNLGQHQKQPSRSRLWQRFAGRIIRFNPPAFKLCDHPCREFTIRREQGNALFRHRERFPNYQRNAQRFLARMRRFDQPHARKSPMSGNQRHPARTRLRRQEQV